MKNREFNQKTLKNITAVKEYVEHIEKFFQSNQMKDHLKFLKILILVKSLEKFKHSRIQIYRVISTLVKNGLFVRL